MCSSTIIFDHSRRYYNLSICSSIIIFSIMLEGLLKLPENRECADCKCKGPRWASVNLGIFTCMQCSGIHRSLGVHISKWLIMRLFFMEQGERTISCAASLLFKWLVCVAYHCLISLYAGTSNLDEVHRVWNSLKLGFPKTTNVRYCVMLHALDRLNDIDGPKRCFEEWESSYSSYDIRLANVAISAYLKNDMIVEAESVLDEAIKRLEGPFFQAWDMFMMFFLKQHRVDSTLKYMEAALGHPKSESVDKVLKYFEEEKNVDGAEELCKMLKKVNRLDSKAYDSLLEHILSLENQRPIYADEDRGKWY
ncbi:Pentatricopeptide repeat-containing protein [Camellia lanceoleosa]|nr:Pentatricopeptide repeat-containing protein [Camellia lanceoleosa]